MSEPADKPLPALNWNDPVACRAWLLDLQQHVGDLRAIAEEQNRRRRRRMFSRAGAREQIKNAVGSLKSAMRYARRGLPSEEASQRKRAGDHAITAYVANPTQETEAALRAVLSPEVAESVIAKRRAQT